MNIHDCVIPPVNDVVLPQGYAPLIIAIRKGWEKLTDKEKFEIAEALHSDYPHREEIEFACYYAFAREGYSAKNIAEFFSRPGVRLRISADKCAEYAERSNSILQGIVYTQNMKTAHQYARIAQGKDIKGASTSVRPELIFLYYLRWMIDSHDPILVSAVKDNFHFSVTGIGDEVGYKSIVVYLQTTYATVSAYAELHGLFMPAYARISKFGSYFLNSDQQHLLPKTQRALIMSADRKRSSNIAYPVNYRAAMIKDGLNFTAPKMMVFERTVLLQMKIWTEQDLTFLDQHVTQCKNDLCVDTDRYRVPSSGVSVRSRDYMIGGIKRRKWKR